MIRLDHAHIWREGLLGETTVTQFVSDGATAYATNSGDDYQRQIAGWVGCGADIPRYNWEHEFIHSFIAQKMWGAESYVVSREARFGGRMSKTAGLFEERWCYHFHCYLNNMKGAVEPEWVEWRAEAREHLEHQRLMEKSNAK